MGKVKILVSDEKPKIEKRKKDIETYFQMLNCFTEGLNKIGIATKKSDKYTPGSGVVEILSKSDKEEKLLAHLVPCILTDEVDLESICIEVYDNKVFECVKKIAEEFSERYNNLKEIAFNTYF